MEKPEPPPDHLGPNLQELVAEHGGYDKIPPAAWRAFDKAIEQWKQRVRSGIWF